MDAGRGNLEGKVALVTGASKGIGSSIARGLAGAGASCIVHYKSDAGGAERTAAAIRQDGGAAVTVQADIAKVSDIDTMFGMVADRFGRIDVLVNNAAITGWSAYFETTEKIWDEVIDTNLKGTFFCSLRAAALMKERGGSIINISSNCAALAVKNLVVYAASKGGIHALTVQLAVELAPFGIRVNTFAPGPTNVARNLQDDPEYRSTWGKVIPLGRTADPEEMIGPALFLASDESSFMTGQIFYVDGGWSVQGATPGGYFESAMEKHADVTTE